MSFPNFESNPLFPQTTIFIGNGFDLSLGLKTKYTDYFNHRDPSSDKKDFWPEHTMFSDDEQLYKVLNGRSEDSIACWNQEKDPTWFDLEDELKKYAKQYSIKPLITTNVPYDKNTLISDQRYFEEIGQGLYQYLIHEVDEWGKDRYCSAKKSAAYQLMYEVCVRASADPNIITFNYTNIVALLKKCDGGCMSNIQLNKNRIHHIHGSLLDEHIILGINEDKDVPKEYDFLFKSWDEHYNSHQVIDILRNSEIVFFFGLSFGSIDSVYFVDFFKSIINGSYDTCKKHIVICTYNEKSMREIYRQFFEMGISIMELKAHCDFNILLTNPDNSHHLLKFESGKIAFWLEEWNNISVDL